MIIRRYRESDREALTDVWLRSVKTTHEFLTEDDIAELLLFVRREAWNNMETWVLESDDQKVAGFMCLSQVKVEGLFIAPEFFRQGLGKRLIDYAKRRRKNLAVDVNEQNKGARAFYRACGFTPFGRSPTDSQGKLFPLIHMEFTRPMTARRTGGTRSAQRTNRTPRAVRARR